MSKGVSNTIIGLFLAVQIALPMSYYFGGNRYDERFAWRMFSPVRLARCSVKLYDESSGSPQQIELSKDLHVVWGNLLKRGRLSVLQGVADDFCSKGKDRVLKADLVCTPPEVALRPICRGTADRDGDGIPDIFVNHRACRGQSAQACYTAECDDQSPEACRESSCQPDRLVPQDLNLCDGVPT